MCITRIIFYARSFWETACRLNCGTAHQNSFFVMPLPILFLSFYSQKSRSDWLRTSAGSGFKSASAKELRPGAVRKTAWAHPHVALGRLDDQMVSANTGGIPFTTHSTRHYSAALEPY